MKCCNILEQLSDWWLLIYYLAPCSYLTENKTHFATPEFLFRVVAEAPYSKPEDHGFETQ
jgi:hypothetical protein